MADGKFLPEISPPPSFWLHDATPVHPPLTDDAEADVAIVGGGVTGAAAARFLARRGARVALVEARTLAGGATGRNAGFLLHGLPETYAQAAWLYGRPLARRIWEFSRENHRLLDEAVKTEGIECGLRRGGSYSLACSGAEWKTLRESGRMLREDGFEAEETPPNRLPAALRGAGAAPGRPPARDFPGALLHARDGEVDPVRLVRGLVAAAVRAGARIFETTRVARVAASRDGLLLTCESGARLKCEVVLYAANAYTPLLHGFFSEILAPVRAQMLALAPLPERIFDRPVYANYGHEYWRQLPDGRVLLGGGREFLPEAEKGYDERPSGEIQGKLDAFRAEQLPALAGASVTHRWAGLMAFTYDGLPLIGTLPGDPRSYVAAGYNGHGLGFAVAAANSLAEMILEGRTDAPPLFSPRRFL